MSAQGKCYGTINIHLLLQSRMINRTSVARTLRKLIVWVWKDIF